MSRTPIKPGNSDESPTSGSPMKRANGSTRIATDGGSALGQNPFAALSGAALPNAAQKPAAADTANANANATAASARRLGTAPAATTANSAAPAKRDRGRVDIRRSKAGRGGKTVSLISGFIGIGAAEKDALCKTMRNACGCGGTVKDGAIEIQGDQREKLAAILRQAGFRPVFAGG